MRLMILDAGLTRRIGHHAQVNRLMAQEARARAIECVIYANRAVDSDVRATLPVQPFFRYRPDQRFSQDPVSGPIESYLFGNQAYLEDLKELDTSRLSGDDILLFHPVNQTQLQAIGVWARDLSPTDPPRIVIGLWFEPHHEAGTMIQGMAWALYRLAFKAFSGPSARRVRFSCVTKGQANLYTEIAQLPCLVTATPHASAGAPVPPANHAAAPCLGFLGYTRQSKGFELIPGVIENLLRSRSPLRFAVQINGEPAELAEMEATIRTLENLAASTPDVRLLRGELEHEDYAATLQACDVLVLPYRRKFYESSYAGVFMDAMNLAKPVIVPTGTWMSRKVGAWSVGTTFDTFASGAVAAAIRPVLDDLPAYRERALGIARQWRETQGVGPFFDFLLSDAPAGGSADRQMH
jgi:glycosyltransferase involved in cell wall biosynthesis